VFRNESVRDGFTLMTLVASIGGFFSALFNVGLIVSYFVTF
jgi:hypothetical protein